MFATFYSICVKRITGDSHFANGLPFSHYFYPYLSYPFDTLTIKVRLISVTLRFAIKDYHTNKF